MLTEQYGLKTVGVLGHSTCFGTFHMLLCVSTTENDTVMPELRWDSNVAKEYRYCTLCQNTLCTQVRDWDYLSSVLWHRERNMGTRIALYNEGCCIQLGETLFWCPFSAGQQGVENACVAPTLPWEHLFSSMSFASKPNLKITWVFASRYWRSLRPVEKFGSMKIYAQWRRIRLMIIENDWKYISPWGLVCTHKYRRRWLMSLWYHSILSSESYGDQRRYFRTGKKQMSPLSSTKNNPEK